MNEFTLDMSRLMGQQQQEEPPKTPPDILAHTLLETYQRYINGNPFSPGDLVTSRRNHGSLMWQGAPHIVLDVFQPMEMVDLMYDGRPTVRPDMRILTESNGELMPYLAESIFYEPWNGDIAIVG